jgi:dTDP-4-dehydrorhamnose 3,5-epimerase-like enzyme
MSKLQANERTILGLAELESSCVWLEQLCSQSSPQVIYSLYPHVSLVERQKSVYCVRAVVFGVVSYLRLDCSRCDEVEMFHLGDARWNRFCILECLAYGCGTVSTETVMAYANIEYSSSTDIKIRWCPAISACLVKDSCISPGEANVPIVSHCEYYFVMVIDELLPHPLQNSNRLLIRRAKGLIRCRLAAKPVRYGWVVHIVVWHTSILPSVIVLVWVIGVHDDVRVLHLIVSISRSYECYHSVGYLTGLYADSRVPLPVTDHILFGLPLADAWTACGGGFLISATTNWDCAGLEGCNFIELYVLAKQALQDLKGFYVGSARISAIALNFLERYGLSWHRLRLIVLLVRAATLGVPIVCWPGWQSIVLVHVDDGRGVCAVVEKLLHRADIEARLCSVVK